MEAAPSRQTYRFGDFAFDPSSPTSVTSRPRISPSSTLAWGTRRAFSWLEKAYEDRAFEILGFSGLLFDQLSDDPRFQDLLRRMRLPTAANRPGR